MQAKSPVYKFGKRTTTWKTPRQEKIRTDVWGSLQTCEAAYLRWGHARGCHSEVRNILIAGVPNPGEVLGEVSAGGDICNPCILAFDIDKEKRAKPSAHTRAAVANRMKLIQILIAIKQPYCMCLWKQVNCGNTYTPNVCAEAGSRNASLSRFKPTTAMSHHMVSASNLSYDHWAGLRLPILAPPRIMT